MAFITDVLDQIGERTGITDITNGLQEGDLDRALHGLRTLSGGPAGLPNPEELTAHVNSNFASSNTSYSGCDVVPIVQIKGTLIALGNVSTISISTNREKEPVRVLGKSYSKYYTGGPRTIAGSITFTLFDRDPFWDIIQHMREELRTVTDRYHTPITDQIPPINIILWFSNEYGRKSLQTLYGVEFLQEGQVHSIQDIYSEKTVNYVAKDMDILLDYKDIAKFRNLMYERQLTGQFTDTYLESLLSYKSQVEKQIADADVIINRINLEKGKRGIVTFGMSSLFGNNDLKEELEKQVRKKNILAIELVQVNQQIKNWSNTVYSAEDYFGGAGSAIHDNLRQAPTAPGPRRGNNPYEPLDFDTSNEKSEISPIDPYQGLAGFDQGYVLRTDANGNPYRDKFTRNGKPAKLGPGEGPNVNQITDEYYRYTSQQVVNGG